MPLLGVTCVLDGALMWTCLWSCFWTHLLCSWLGSLDVVHPLSVPGAVGGPYYQHPALAAVFGLCRTVLVSEGPACPGAALGCWLAFPRGAAH